MTYTSFNFLELYGAVANEVKCICSVQYQIIRFRFAFGLLVEFYMSLYDLGLMNLGLSYEFVRWIVNMVLGFGPLYMIQFV